MSNAKNLTPEDEAINREAAERADAEAIAADEGVRKLGESRVVTTVDAWGDTRVVGGHTTRKVVR